MAFYTDALTSKFSFMHAISSAWDAYKAEAHKRAAYRTTLRELSALSDHELDDLGLHRSQIKNIALESSDLT
ncbi:MAG: DUF1127 domain-containing protein [Pseudomonadota bacterium]